MLNLKITDLCLQNTYYKPRTLKNETAKTSTQCYNKEKQAQNKESMLHLFFAGVMLVFWVSWYGRGAMVNFLIYTNCMLKYQEPVVLS